MQRVSQAPILHVPACDVSRPNGVDVTDTIIRSGGPVTLLGASVPPGAELDEALAVGPRLVAADGGAATALSRGLMPEAVIGDFDSLESHVRKRIPHERLHIIPEQESTDFDKALCRIQAPLVLAVGFTGGRIDHELAAYNSLVRNADLPVIVIGERDICFHLPDELELDLLAGTRISLFPMARMRCFSIGLHWSTAGLVFDPAGRVGTSNRVTSGVVTLRPEMTGMLVILPRSQLGAAAGALRG